MAEAALLPAVEAAVTVPVLLFIPETAAIWAGTVRTTIAIPDIVSAVTTCHTRFVTLTHNHVAA